jgi:formylglycine-generating enzyme
VAIRDSFDWDTLWLSMKQGRVSRSLFVLLAAGTIAACQVVSGLSSLSEPDEPPGTDGADGAAEATGAEAAGPPVDGAFGDGGLVDAPSDAKDAAYEAAPSLSCVGMPAHCATYDELDGALVGVGESCCARRDVPAGTTSRTFGYVDGGLVDAGATATLSSFALDRFEVTVGRFKAFLEAYEAGWRPAVGSGRALRAAGDTGWTLGAALAPGAALRAEVAACEESTLGADGRLPINCITYAEAFAMCIFDGGRLPTEAEWSAAAVGGAELRLQPFSVPPSQVLFLFDYFQTNSTGPSLVGFHSAGDGKFGHADLLGNMTEWVRDAYVAPYPAGACNDCLVDVPDASRAVRGTSFAFSGSLANAPRNTTRAALDPSTRTWDVGVRCAYDLP